MINKNIKTNNEFYICPVYNEAINDNKNIFGFDIKFDPDTELVSCILNQDLINDSSFTTNVVLK
mgnify:CR=1 FL=1